MWVTMTEDGPEIANIALKGVFDRKGLDPSLFGAYDRKGAETDEPESLGEITDLGVPTAVADPGTVDGNDKFSSIRLVPGAEGKRYNFGERPQPGDARH